MNKKVHKENVQILQLFVFHLNEFRDYSGKSSHTSGLFCQERELRMLCMNVVLLMAWRKFLVRIHEKLFFPTLQHFLGELIQI